MAQIIFKIKDRYFIYYTVTDGVSEAMTRTQLDAWAEEEYSALDFQITYPGMMQRVESKGTSSRVDKSMHETISGNRAGKNGKTLTANEIYRQYARTLRQCDEQALAEIHKLRVQLGAAENNLLKAKAPSVKRFSEILQSTQFFINSLKLGTGE